MIEKPKMELVPQQKKTHFLKPEKNDNGKGISPTSPKKRRLVKGKSAVSFNSNLEDADHKDISLYKMDSLKQGLSTNACASNKNSMLLSPINTFSLQAPRNQMQVKYIPSINLDSYTKQKLQKSSTSIINSKNLDENQTVGFNSIFAKCGSNSSVQSQSRKIVQPPHTEQHMRKLQKYKSCHHIEEDEIDEGSFDESKTENLRSQTYITPLSIAKIDHCR